MPDPNQPLPQAVLPQPLPLQIGIQHVDGPAGTLVVITIASPQGQQFYFLTPTDAQSIGGQLRAAGKQAATGLIVPPSGGLVTP